MFQKKLRPGVFSMMSKRLWQKASNGQEKSEMTEKVSAGLPKVALMASCLFPWDPGSDKKRRAFNRNQVLHLHSGCYT